ncbi:MAG: hypothetical protein NXI09_04850 [Bacteroidetes bacterium]|nr:hypothetical protein [Bacteroidota bacterium]
MNFRASFCDPFKPDIVEMGDIEKENILETFENIPWNQILEKMAKAKAKEIYFSPSLEIENKDNKNGLSVSALDTGEWYIFYKRPKMLKKFFGLREKMEENYLSSLTGQTENDVRECLKALIENDLAFLEEKIK